MGRGAGTGRAGAVTGVGSGWREGAVLATAFALCLLGGVVRVDDTVSAPPGSAYLIALVSCASLAVRHRSAFRAVLGTTAAGVLVPLLGLLLSPLSAAPAVISAYAYARGARSERRALAVVAASAVTLCVAATPLSGGLSWQDASRMGSVAVFPLMAGLLGHAAHSRRAYLAAVEERASRAEQSREREARQRVAEERVRIARELHDLVAHQITLANAQATVAAHLFDTRPEQTRKSLHELVRTTGDALDELRATVGLLRQPDDAAGSAEPAPGLSRLPALLDSFRRAGLEVAVQEEGTARPLPPGLDLTAYRILQESLTNVTKHAGTGTARVRLGWERDRVRLSVSDAGPSASDAGPSDAGPSDAGPSDAGPSIRTVPGAAAAPQRPPGYGLIGMRERAAAVGGRLAAGKRPEGGFRVTAELPLPPTTDPKRQADGATSEERMTHAATDDERTDDGPAGGRTDDGPVSERTDDGPVSGRTDDGPAGGRTDDGPLSERTDDGPLSERTDDGPAGGRTDDGPLSERTDDGPLSGRTDGRPYGGAADSRPGGGHTDARPGDGPAGARPVSAPANPRPRGGGAAGGPA